MEPWEDEAERAEYRRVLLPLGANDDQAEIVRLVGWLYKDQEIAEIRGVSVSKVKQELRILSAILKLKGRDRHVLGREARCLVEAQRRVRERPKATVAVPLPKLKLVKKRRHSGRGASAGSAHDSDGEPRAG